MIAECVISFHCSPTAIVPYKTLFFLGGNCYGKNKLIIINRHLIMGPATIVGTLPEKTGTSGTAKTYISRGGENFVLQL